MKNISPSIVRRSFETIRVRACTHLADQLAQLASAPPILSTTFSSSATTT